VLAIQEEGRILPDGHESVHAPTATISKFNRMGFLAGWGSRDVRMLRMGTAYNPDPQAAVPVQLCSAKMSSNSAKNRCATILPIEQSYCAWSKWFSR